MKLSDFSYQLPKELIAHHPAEPRGSSRLMVVNKQTGELDHHHFFELPNLLQPGDVLVRNNSKVMPARLFGQKYTGGLVEVLLVKKLASEENSETWEALTKPGIKAGTEIRFADSKLSTKCTHIDGYTRVLVFNQAGIELLKTLDLIGTTPLPHYIRWSGTDQTALREAYQTSYAKYTGSVAAPTAGLHFTPQLDQRLKFNGIQIVELTLHVGLGTFLPVKSADISDHQMHTEWCSVSAETAETVNSAKQRGQRIIAVGTTSLRTLEWMSSAAGKLQAGDQENQLYVYPEFQFKIANGLITNFHLPESTLLMLVSAFTSSPNTPWQFHTFASSKLGHAYQTAIDHGYRFFSFGDAMLIL